tara:strand:- start:2767 stop:3429 length:663 start_codon:yes stop_codon:yes gene_type:complete
MREKLVKARQGLKKYLTELKKFDPESYKMIRYNIESSISNIAKNVNTIDEKLALIVKKDSRLTEVFEMVNSVTGSGRITALYLMTATNLFTKCSNPKQLASYCGVVPFQYTSGKSVKKKPRVHFMANKKLKSLLHMCALSAARYDHGLKTYFERKVDQVKNSMLLINNIWFYHRNHNAIYRYNLLIVLVNNSLPPSKKNKRVELFDHLLHILSAKQRRLT